MESDFNNIDEKLLLEDERIVKYLKGQMSADEERAFLLELQNDTDLKAKAIAVARLVKGMKEVGSVQDKELVSEMLATSDGDVKDIALSASGQKPKAKVIPWRKASMWLSMAASIALLVWVGIGYNDYRVTTGLGDEYATAFTSSQLSRGGDDTTEVETKLANLYDNVVAGKDLKTTIHDLTLCWELSTQETYNDYTDFAPEIGWNLAIAHLKNNDRKQAQTVLTRLVEVAPEGTAIGDKARELLKKVNEL